MEGLRGKQCKNRKIINATKILSAPKFLCDFHTGSIMRHLDSPGFPMPITRSTKAN